MRLLAAVRSLKIRRANTCFAWQSFTVTYIQDDLPYFYVMVDSNHSSNWSNFEVQTTHFQIFEAAFSCAEPKNA
jgi:hypothetical protein